MDIRKVDALELLQSLSDKSVDLILTDPPYYKLLNIAWDKQWKTKYDYLIWLDAIVKECQRGLKDNGSFYMFASPEMSWHVEGVIRKHFNVLNNIRWRDKESMARRVNREELRRFISNSEQIIFAEQFVASSAFIQSKYGLRGNVFEPIRKYLDDARIQATLSPDQCNKICGNQMARHYFLKHTMGVANRSELSQVEATYGLEALF